MRAGGAGRDLQHSRLREGRLAPERVQALLRTIYRGSQVRHDTAAQERASLGRKQREVDAKMARLYDALEQGTVAQDDFFRSRVNAAKAERDDILKLKAQLERRTALPLAISPRKLEAFCLGMAEMLRSGDIQFRKAYLRLFISEVQVEENAIRISGSDEALLAAASAGLPPGSEVPTFF
jgi:site-specific DNA recombinase